MALSRLLQPNSKLPICVKRFSTTKAVFCSYSGIGRTHQLKNDVAVEENRDMTVEPLVNDSAQTKPDMLSKVSSSWEKKGAPRYMGVVHILKDKMLGHDRPQNYYAIDESIPADCTALVVIPSSDASVHGTIELEDSKVNVDHGKSCMADKIYDKEVNGTASEVNQMRSCPQAAKTEDNDAFKTKRMLMSPGVSSLSSGDFCEKATQSNDSELVAEEAEFLKDDDVSSSTFSDLEGDLVSNPENSSSLQAPAISLKSTECVNIEKKETIIGDISVNIGSERGRFSAISDGSKKTASLVDLFRQKNQYQRSPEGNIAQADPEEALSDLIIKFERKRVSQLKHSSPADYLLSVAKTSDSEDDHFKEISHIECENNPQGDKSLRFEWDQTTAPSNGSKSIFVLKDANMKSVDDQIVDENFKPRSLTFTQSQHSNEPNEVDTEKLSEIKELIDFIKLQDGVPSTSANDNRDTSCITENPSNSNSQGFIYNDWLTASTTENSSPENQKKSDAHFQSFGGTGLKASFVNPTMKINEEKLRNGLLSESSNSKLQNLVDGESSNSSDCTTVRSRIEDEERVDLDFGSLGWTELKAGMEIPNPTKNIDRGNVENTFLSSKEANDNRVVVRFLPKVTTEEHILETFERYGAISKIEIIDVEGHVFKTAHIHFETRKGLQRALKESYVLVRNKVVTVESATRTKKVTVSVPNLICDPEVPTLLIKNPTRTVKIHHLTRDIRLHHIERALSFCESNVSGYFLGSTNSVGFIEFETEVGKERALVKHSIDVLGQQLNVLRIDAPRTTAVRVSSGAIRFKNIISICSSFGKVRNLVARCPGIVDVHYRLAEWPNMWNILNRLNSLEIEGMRLRAEPATNYPPDVLIALWHQPNERTYLKNTALALLEKLGKNMRGTTELDFLEQLFMD
ncbi:dentin sialophosphoprotein-like [Dorcoceras hygrometricum]|uniref:Dentin sialophosphoprotein-like n=1 Tax=Dorcoceras hygrometricum TaxID=472368 RepID=A0A2Z7D7B9_9LAMI|nr:dentin sialophosphoprotein-like [Dorcoceras hygrometricum]